MREHRLSDAVGTAGGVFGLLFVLVLGIAVFTIPDLVVLSVVSVAWPTQLRVDGPVSLGVVALGIAVASLLGELVAGRLLRNHPVRTVMADLARRSWDFVISWTAALVVLRYSPGVEAYGLAPVILVAGVSSGMDLMAGYAVAVRRERRECPARGHNGEMRPDGWALGEPPVTVDDDLRPLVGLAVPVAVDRAKSMGSVGRNLRVITPSTTALSMDYLPGRINLWVSGDGTVVAATRH